MILETITSFISGIFSPAKELVSEAIVDKDLKAKLQVEVTRMENDVKLKILELESQRMELQSKLTETVAATAQQELNSDSWLAKNYRPIITLVFGGLIVAASFGVCQIDQMIYDTFGLVFGIYGSSRGLEKIAQVIKK